MKATRILIATTLAIVMAFVMAQRADAQTVVVRTNLAAWAAQGANIGIDFAVNDYQTVGATALMTMGDSWIEHVNGSGFQLDYRFWLKRKLLQDFYVGPQLGLYHYRKDEPADTKRHAALTAGLVAGYGWMISRHWNIDVMLGAGYLLYADPEKDHRFVPTNLGVNLAYVF